MNAKENADRGPSPPSDLRREAERRLHDKQAAPVESVAEVDVRALVHELQVHQIELEMQNEELIRTQAALLEASEKFQDLFDFAPVGYFLLDEQDRILEINLAGAALLGLDRSTVVNGRLGRYVAAQSRARYAQYCTDMLRADGKQTCEIEFLRGTEHVCALLEGMPEHDGQGRRTFRVTANDITERKRADEELRQAKEAAEAANQAKDRFLALLSHELRTPLMPITLGISMLQDRSDFDASTRETLEMIGRSADMEALLIDDLLDVTRIASGKVELQKQRSDLYAILRDAVDVCRHDIEARALDFGVDMGSAAPYWVEADPRRLQQVFWNLLKNAIKFTPHGGRVGIRCRPDDQGYVVVEVNDSGVGIETSALSRLFHAFEQLDPSVTRQFGGLGLGLAISKAMVEMHGGQIEAHSEGRNKGATFRVRLPRIAPADQSEVPAPPATRQRTVQPLHILLVEDHPVSAKMLKIVLTEDRHTVETAGDVATALQLAARQSFDLILSDLGLPDSSGHDLMRELRVRGYQFPGIALSANGRREDIQRSYEAGFAAHLTKPASREVIAETIAAVTVGTSRRWSSRPPNRNYDLRH